MIQCTYLLPPRCPTRPEQYKSQPCALPPNPNPMADVNRALLDRLHGWVVRDEAPPASVYPKIADGSLIPETELAKRFPFIPGVPSPDGIANPTLFYNFGPGFRPADLSGYISIEPPQVIGVLPTYLPAIDGDGNEIAGVRTVLAQVPLGTYLGWNVFASGFDKGKFCSLTGSYVPFAETKQERLAHHDPRLSLEERYGTHEEYVNKVRNATARLAKAGFLLPDDAAKLLNEAEGSDMLRKLATHE